MSATGRAWLLLMIASSACGENEPAPSVERASQDPRTPCEMPPVSVRPAGGTVVIQDGQAPCTIEFRDVVTLRGALNGVSPRNQVALGAGGTYVTNTYNPNEVAFWSPSGELDHVLVMGRGDGPGELNGVGHLLVDTLAARLYVFTEGWRIETYTLSGTFLRRITLRDVSIGPSLAGVLLPDGTVVTTSLGARGQPRPMLIVIRGDSVERTGPVQKGYLHPVLHAGRDGLWSMETFWYGVSHHRMPDGQVDFHIRRDVSWFPDATSAEAGGGSRSLEDGLPGAAFRGFAVDEAKGLVFTSVQVEDPNAPAEPMYPLVNGERRIPPRDEARKLTPLYTDALLEVFTMDGRLIATRRYDDRANAPTILTADRWFQVTEDELSIRILEPVLVKNPDSR